MNYGVATLLKSSEFNVWFANTESYVIKLETGLKFPEIKDAQYFP